MKTLHLIAWIAGIIAVILVLLGTVAYIFKLQLIGINHVVNFFHVANSYLLIAIVCILFKKIVKE
jgi:hypothetical protein